MLTELLPGADELIPDSLPFCFRGRLIAKKLTDPA